MASIANSLRSKFQPVRNLLGSSPPGQIIGRGNPISDPFESLSGKGTGVGKTGTSILSYPLGVDSGENPHYIIFDVFKQIRPKIRKSNKKGLTD